jgi:tRNA-Thr(GGU) m(6)t(6)A37 methyltransferase TsaA
MRRCPGTSNTPSRRSRPGWQPREGRHEVTSPTEQFELRPVGAVSSSLRDLAHAPRQGDEGAPDAWIVIDERFEGALDGVEPGQRLIVLTWLHLARRDVIAVHPRDDLDRPKAGVFATRSSDRPNPIGLHEVQVLAVDRSRVHVSPLEAVDGTPVLDLKPVLGRAHERQSGEPRL